mmetsp:Transcript_9420/g.13990  ORF Transcript_9420/g.13990 Transcript_9420/m.13990 type:complete len:370 (+) Transcript_9420:39-1148(+)
MINRRTLQAFALLIASISSCWGSSSEHCIRLSTAARNVSNNYSNRRPARLPSGFHSSSSYDNNNKYYPQQQAASYAGTASNKRKEYRRTEYDSNLRPYRGVSPRSKAQQQAQRRGSSITAKIVAANVAMFFVQVLSPAVTKWGANVPALIRYQPRRFLTPLFLHGTLSHLAVNSYSLLNTGPAMERILGSKLFIATYLISGAAGNAMTATFSKYPSVGASSAICGLVGAYGVFIKRNQDFFGASGEQALRQIQTTTVLNVILGLASPMIDNWGHFGGTLGGMAASYVLGPRLYKMDLPSGNGSILVNIPLVQVPQHIYDQLNELPCHIKLKVNQIKRKMHLEHHFYALPEARRKKLKYRRYHRNQTQRL